MTWDTSGQTGEGTDPQLSGAERAGGADSGWSITRSQVPSGWRRTMAAVHHGCLRALVISDVEMLALLTLTWTMTPSPALPEFLGHARRTFAGAR